MRGFPIRLSKRLSDANVIRTQAAEDMEGFAVAMACALNETPLRIVRGISNEVGDREPANWRIPLALGAARELAMEVLESDGNWIVSAVKDTL